MSGFGMADTLAHLCASLSVAIIAHTMPNQHYALNLLVLPIVFVQVYRCIKSPQPHQAIDIHQKMQYTVYYDK